jgi:hypothetical protein
MLNEKAVNFKDIILNQEILTKLHMRYFKKLQMCYLLEELYARRT